MESCSNCGCSNRPKPLTQYMLLINDFRIQKDKNIPQFLEGMKNLLEIETGKKLVLKVE